MFDPDAFSTDFELEAGDPPQDDPEPEPEPTNGPWISHGVVHLSHRPRNH